MPRLFCITPGIFRALAQEMDAVAGVEALLEGKLELLNEVQELANGLCVLVWPLPRTGLLTIRVQRALRGADGRASLLDLGAASVLLILVRCDLGLQKLRILHGADLLFF